MKLVATRKAEQNQAVVDPWTAVHVASGLALGLMDVPFRWSLAAAVVYEAFEQYAERERWGQEMFETSGPEIVANAAMDVAVFAVGHALGTAWNRS